MLNQDDKIERFAEVINKNAEKKCKQIEAKAEQFRKKELEELETQSENELKSRLEFEKIRLSNETNRKISRMESESKKKIAKKREKIVADVFEKVKSKLFDFAESAEYDAFLENSIKSLCSEIEKDVVIYVRERDVEKADKLVSALDCVIDVEASAEIEIGGAFASNKEKTIFVYDTLDARLENQKEIFMSKSGLAAV